MMMQSASTWLYKGHNKLVMMGYIDFKDHALIKRWWANKKMNVMGGKFKDEKKWGNHQKQFAFVVGNCVHFQSSKVHSNMSAKNVIEKSQKITKEMKVHRNEHKGKQEGKAKLLKKIKTEEELRRVEHEGMLNIQLLVIRSSLHSTSSLECAEEKTYNENMQFVQMTIHYMCRTRTSAVEFFS